MRRLSPLLRRLAPPTIGRLGLLMGRGQSLCHALEEYEAELAAPARFVTLVRRYVRPTARAAILQGESEWDRVSQFAEAFSERYFPIYAPDSYLGIADGITSVPFGWGDYELDSLPHCAGRFCLLALLLGRAWLAPDCHGWHDLQGRYPGLRGLPALTDWILETGLAPRQADAIFAGTAYGDVALYSRWLYGETGIDILDLSEESGLDFSVSWEDRAEIRARAHNWRTAAKPVLDRCLALEDRIAADVAGHLPALLALVEAGYPGASTLGRGEAA